MYLFILTCSSTVLKIPKVSRSNIDAGTIQIHSPQTQVQLKINLHMTSAVQYSRPGDQAKPRFYYGLDHKDSFDLQSAKVNRTALLLDGEKEKGGKRAYQGTTA